MAVYVVRRLAQTMVVLLLLSVVFFLMVRFQPAGQCAYNISCVQRLNLDEPISSQYLGWLGAYLHGDLGLSNGGESVNALIAQKLPPTLVLTLSSFVIQQCIALPLGVLAATRQYSRYDQILTFASYIALSVPAFVLGLILIYLFGVQWSVLPVGHASDETLPLLGSGDWVGALIHQPGFVLGDSLRHLLLPAFVLTVTGIAIDSRFMRTAMLSVLHEDYIRTARSKGLSRRAILFKHAFRNAVLPIITNMALYVPTLVGGVIIVETVFTWGGIGYLFGSAIKSFDWQTLQALLLLGALVTLLANLLADVAYAWLDPRIHYEA